MGLMDKNLDIITYAVSLIIKATIMAARFSGRVRKRSLKHGSISVTERVIKTLKYELLKRVPLIKDFDHLMLVCTEFETWYNSWRPHMTLNGLRPDDLYYSRNTEKPDRNSKTVPCNIERHVFQETRITGYRLKSAA